MSPHQTVSTPDVVPVRSLLRRDERSVGRAVPGVFLDLGGADQSFTHEWYVDDVTEEIAPKTPYQPRAGFPIPVVFLVACMAFTTAFALASVASSLPGVHAAQQASEVIEVLVAEVHPASVAELAARSR